MPSIIRSLEIIRPQDFDYLMKSWSNSIWSICAVLWQPVCLRLMSALRHLTLISIPVYLLSKNRFPKFHVLLNLLYTSINIIDSQSRLYLSITTSLRGLYMDLSDVFFLTHPNTFGIHTALGSNLRLPSYLNFASLFNFIRHVCDEWGERRRVIRSELVQVVYSF